MLREIYNQADSPDFHNLETQGSLYANSQEIQDGILRFIFHVLPKKEELEVESTMVTLR
jgi:hypothetical protein